ncbi:GvpL/GvpF family gas vesicle protein [Streptomyces sp. NPDC051315]|uniref:GvpL/GvpF family gas vesicle protein n=1 Tax=Streptomyces sp. NPDC051315 TaxID=3365650 RepID=UPI0037A12FBD
MDRGSAERFLAAVDELRQEHPHLEPRVHGPLPPYSFPGTPSSHQAEGGNAEAWGTATAQPTNGSRAVKPHARTTASAVPESRWMVHPHPGTGKR